MEGKKRRRIKKRKDGNFTKRKFIESTSHETNSRENPLEIKKYKTELYKTRNSVSYRLGNVFVNAIIKPWKIILLPFNLIGVSWGLAAERVGLKSSPQHDDLFNHFEINKKTIVLFPTNGVGFGHFTRMLALAKKIKKQDKEIEIIFFTTMSALHLLKEQGDFIAYHIPGRKTSKKMSAKKWNTIVEEFMTNVFAIHNPSLFIFDGAYPYRGMLNSIRNHSKLKKIWLRRGTLKKGISKIPLETVNYFNYIIKPKDSIDVSDETEEIGNCDLITCNPILLLEKEELDAKDVVRDKLGIPLDKIVVYVQLGAGKINDINSEINLTLKILNKYKDVYVVLGESMIGDRMKFSGPRIRIIRDYPNSRFFNGFDFAIMAAGYNSFHEAVKFSLPTIFYPNLDTGRDDQLARAKIAEDLGAMVVLTIRNEKRIEAAIKRLLEKEVRKRMRKNCLKLHEENGAEQIAKYLIERFIPN